MKTTLKKNIDKIDMDDKLHELNNWTCGVIHHDKRGCRLPECRQCKNCGKWIGFEESNSECFGKQLEERKKNKE